MTGRPLIGLVLALVVEARHWTRFRWEFDDDACGRAWQVCVILIAFAAILIWLDGSRHGALTILISWLPPMLLPMQFVQSYGMRNSLPLGIFSFLARRRRERNQRLGLIEETRDFHFGNVFFATTLVAATVGTESGTWLFLPALVALTGWALLSTGRARPLTLVPVLAIAGLLALMGKTGLQRAYERAGGGASARSGAFDPNFSPTMIGSRGVVQQSQDIVWRLRTTEKSVPPRLLRTASYNTFHGTDWQNVRMPLTDFKDLGTRLIGGVSYFLLRPADDSDIIPTLPGFSLRGAASAESPLPIPGDAAGMRDFELEGIERNTFGTIRLFPKQSVIEGQVFWNGGTNPEFPPLPQEDLRIPSCDQEAIREIAAELRLDQDTDLRIKLAMLRAWFVKNFHYTRNLTIRHGVHGDSRSAPVSRFLTTVRAGHCEYFASASALLLRAAGIPARYAVGYAVMERNTKRGEFVIRGSHSHAWCRVWDESTRTWLDFDPTPPDWTAMVSQKPGFLQSLNDNMKRLREDFSLWRNRPANRLAVTLGMIAVGLGLSGFIANRLWHSKRRLESVVRSGAYDGPEIRTPLHELEAQARKHLGPRSPGQTFADWLALLRPSLPNAPLLDEAIALHQQLRFDPASHPPAHRERLAALAAQLKSALRRA